MIYGTKEVAVKELGELERVLLLTAAMCTLSYGEATAFYKTIDELDQTTIEKICEELKCSADDIKHGIFKEVYTGQCSEPLYRERYYCRGPKIEKKEQEVIVHGETLEQLGFKKSLEKRLGTLKEREDIVKFSVPLITLTYRLELCSGY